MMAAIPALLSAPNSVDPSEVTISLPINRDKLGVSSGEITMSGLAGNRISSP